MFYKVIHTPGFHSLNGSFWPPKYLFEVNILVNFFSITFKIQQLSWSDH
jgi:hypothetical protein